MIIQLLNYKDPGGETNVCIQENLKDSWIPVIASENDHYFDRGSNSDLVIYYLWDADMSLNLTDL